MSAAEAPSRHLHSGPALGHTLTLGVEGARVYLQVKGGAGTSGRIPKASHIPEYQTIPPDNCLPSTADANGLCGGNATFTKSQPELFGARGTHLKQAPASRKRAKPAGREHEGKKNEAPRGRRRVKLQEPKVQVGMAGDKRTTTSRSGGSGAQRGRGSRGQSGRGSVTAGRRELQRILQARDRISSSIYCSQCFLAGKYGALWGKKVFGRVLPSVARSHCNRRLKRQSFGVWCGQWWAARREWKLNIRADCHNRYRLWILVWKHWTEFVRCRKVRKSLKHLATDHNERRVVRRAWSGWCAYHRERKMRLQSRKRAKQWHLTHTLRAALMMWRESLQRKRGRDVMYTAAIHHWSTRLLTQVWGCWVEQYSERVRVWHKMAVAEQHWMARQKAACWTTWTLYTDHRRRKRHLNDMAVESRSWWLLRRQFTLWQKRLERARELANFQRLVEEMGKRAVKRRALSQWRHYMELVLYEEHLVHIATCHYSTSLKSKAVEGMRVYSRQQQLQRRHKSLASAHRHHNVLEQSWCVWLRRCEHCEEIKMLPHTRRARGHFRLLSLRRFFPAWRAFVVLRRHKKAKLTLANQHFKFTALPKCFAALRDYSAMQRHKKELLCRAQCFRSENLMSFGFYQWWRALHISQELHSMERVAVLHYERWAKITNLKRWRTELRLKLLHLRLEHSAVEHHQMRLLIAALNKWRDHRSQRVVSRQQYLLALTHYSHKSLTAAWIAWRNYVERRRQRKARYAWSIAHYHTALLHNVLRDWQAYHCHGLRKKEKRVRAVKFFSTSLKRHTLRQWRENVYWNLTQRDLNMTALSHFKNTVCFKCFSQWRELTVQNLETAQRERQRVHEMSVVLTQKKLWRVLASWREHTNSSTVRRIANERAVIHYHHTLLHRCLTAWSSRHRLALRKMLLSRQSAHFSRNHLVSTYYSKWRVELMRAVIVKHKSVVALWHWGQHLQRKALVCWLLYAMNRKRKAERYAQALESHRCLLLHIGVTQWVQFATSMQAQREESALQQQTQTTQSVMQCVRRCARRWKDTVRRREKYSNNLSSRMAVARAKGSQVPPSEDIWTAIARKHQISAVPGQPRPQPRSLHSLGAESVGVASSGLVPRSSAPHPLTPPALYTKSSQQSGRGSREGVVTTPSFTFLPSTVSTLSVVEHQAHHCLAGNSATQTAGFRPDPVLAGPPSCVEREQMSGALVLGQPQPVLLPPSAFAHKSSETVVSINRGGGGESLGDPTVRSQIVHVRDELRRYHQMRLKQRSLKEQVALAQETGSQELPELQLELSRLADELHKAHPMIQELVAQVQSHLSPPQT